MADKITRMSNPNTTTDTIRDAAVARAEQLGLTAYAVGQATGIDAGMVRRWFRGSRSVTTVTAAAILAYLELDIVEMQQKPNKNKGRKISKKFAKKGD